MNEKRPPVIGIDLGTTFSAMAVVNRYGKPEIVPNDDGHATTPSLIFFDGPEDVVVGQEAAALCGMDPSQAAQFVKRSMGDPDMQFLFFDREYRPQEISGLVLRKLKEHAERALGHPVQDAVITVPAYFDALQRGATREAGVLAGLNVMSVINEPTAAAIAYGLDHSGDSTFMVFDLGGGTFDVTVMQSENGTLHTRATGGNAEHGGKEWDDRIIEHIADQFLEEHGIDPRDDAVSYQSLADRCVAAKHALSTRDKAIVTVQCGGRVANYPVHRRDFEVWTADLLEYCLDTAAIVMDEAGLSWQDLDDIVLVGGSTRMPMIRDSLARVWGKQPEDRVHPDECVALGAALAGAIRHRAGAAVLGSALPESTLPASWDVPDFEAIQPAPAQPSRGASISLAEGGSPMRFQDLSTQTLGMVILDKNGDERIIPVIPRGTPLPYERTGKFVYAYDDMRAIKVEITEGIGSTRDEVSSIGTLYLTNLPPRPKGTPIKVTYRYTADQALSVSVTDVQTGRTNSSTIELVGTMSQGDIESSKQITSQFRIR